MAIDSALKRASCIGLCLPFAVVQIIPDGIFGQPDRQDAAYSYSGISAAAPSVATGGGVIKPVISRAIRRVINREVI